MAQEQHVKEIKNSLAALDNIFNKEGINYRVVGSVLVAAINEKPHRTLGDIDILLERSNWQLVADNLKREGYQLVKKSKVGFNWFEAHKTNSLGFTFLLIGSFQDDYFEYELNHMLKLRIASSYLSPTKYSIFGYSFTGIPQRSIYEGLKASNLNPKRKLDKQVVASAFKNKIPKGTEFEKAFRIYLYGREIPYAYPSFSYLYNLYGGLRVTFGKKYEILPAWSVLQPLYLG